MSTEPNAEPTGESQPLGGLDTATTQAEDNSQHSPAVPEHLQPPPAAEFNGPEWMNDLPENLKSSPSLTKFNSVEDLANSYNSLQGVLGRDKIPVPSADATEEEWGEVYSRLGRPETAEDYDFSEIQVPEGVERRDDIDGSYKELAHQLGLNPRQATELYNWSNAIAQEVMAEQAEQLQAYRQEQMQNLQNDWGQDAQYNMNKANNALKAFATPDVMEALEESGLSYHPGFIKMMHQIGSAMDEDSTRMVENVGNPGMQHNITAADAKTELADLMNPKSPYWNKSSPGHQAAKARVTLLNRVIYGDSPAD